MLPGAWLHPELLQDWLWVGAVVFTHCSERFFIAHEIADAPITWNTGNLLHFSVQNFVANSC